MYRNIGIMAHIDAGKVRGGGVAHFVGTLFYTPDLPALGNGLKGACGCTERSLDWPLRD